MSYQALYRVWRPQSFIDVVGQEHITKTLQNALLQQKISHAYLFSGPRGTGKTSAAKILAKAVNCEQAPTAEPCNECASCRGITDGSIQDVIEIDAASNNGVDEIRDIRDKVKYAPSAVRYKVYIIDEVHMLSTGAFNALLKTLEEPPRHVMFILATTEPHKIPLTIISRCQRFDFKRITSQSIVGRMELIMKESGLAYDEKALPIIARAAEGGMRDALSLLDQALSYSDDQLTEEDALTVTGAVGQGMLNELAEAILEKDTAAALAILEKLLMQGKDPARFAEDFVLYFRDMLLYKTAPHLEESLARVMIDEVFVSVAEKMELESIYEYIHILNETQQEMKFSNHARIYMEVALVKICQRRSSRASVDMPEVQELIGRIQALEKEIQQLRSQPIQQAEQADAQAPSRRPARSSNGFRAPAAKIEKVLSEATKQDIQLIKSRWGEMLDILGQRQMRSQAALLNDAEPVAASKEAFVLKFKYEIHCQMASENKRFIDTISSILQELAENTYQVVCVPEEAWLTIRKNFIKTQKADSNEQEAEQSEDPLIAEALKLVGEDLLEVKD
ncbi:DNA polymerase III subunit gamma/tau [Pseudobacillus wudalianchiensis]|uniref:DNA-directed DNA polymerase n=1 Tax=Pseudobacillus wudalianchiensis TaxID=1743143 RepID=A0A1B9B016_9BACI|nr:DNA polymerase III subunit gamma/tau [Bacillus wudalianchiensis]OCA89371.1 DNA polymerase III subunit gamma/tau [Bacillus wudalianchiensis]